MIGFMRPYRLSKHLKIIKKYELKKRFFRKVSITSALNLTNDKPQSLALYQTFFPRFSNIGRAKSICFLTNKPRSVFRKFKIARIAFRELVSFTVLTGVKKAMW